MKIAICSHPEKKNALGYMKNISSWLNKRGHEIVNEDSEKIDIAIVLAGDGYTMHMAGKFSPIGVPVIALNIGDIGFLTARNISDYQELLERLDSDNYKIEKRMGLGLNFNSDKSGPCKNKKLGPFVNDIYLKHSQSMGIFKIRVDDDVIYKGLRADGFIVSTPTGSTAYNMGARGPILLPNMSAFALTPICPYNCNTWPIVADSKSEIRIKVISTRGMDCIHLIADGNKICDLFAGEEIMVNKHETKMLFAVLDRRDYLAALQKKKGLMD